MLTLTQNLIWGKTTYLLLNEATLSANKYGFRLQYIRLHSFRFNFIVIVHSISTVKKTVSASVFSINIAADYRNNYSIYSI